jgi:peptide/nickel transport system ATP-binding protein
MTENIIEVNNLKVNFTTYEGTMKVLDGVNLHIRKGEIIGLVGETGCGKTMTGRAIMRILPSNARVVTGKIFFENSIDLLTLDQDEMRKIRGKTISLIFQEPRRALHPTFDIGGQISEIYSLHMKEDIIKSTIQNLEEEIKESPSDTWLNMLQSIYQDELNGKRSILKKVLEKIPFVKSRLEKPINKVLSEKSMDMLEKVQIPDPSRVSKQYPHELSGGMMQRVLISMALACNPKLLIADEPTTAVDVTTQAKILDLIMDLKKTYNASILLITHNLAVVAETCDRVSVMYAGTIVEEADTSAIFKEPLHPYTQGLLDAIPIIGQQKELTSIPGSVPNFLMPPEGCRFHPRCELADHECSIEKPVFREVKENHYVACHKI